MIACPAGYGITPGTLEWSGGCAALCDRGRTGQLQELWTAVRPKPHTDQLGVLGLVVGGEQSQPLGRLETLSPRRPADELDLDDGILIVAGVVSDVAVQHDERHAARGDNLYDGLDIISVDGVQLANLQIAELHGSSKIIWTTAWHVI